MLPEILSARSWRTPRSKLSGSQGSVRVCLLVGLMVVSVFVLMGVLIVRMVMAVVVRMLVTVGMLMLVVVLVLMVVVLVVVFLVFVIGGHGNVSVDGRYAVLLDLADREVEA